MGTGERGKGQRRRQKALKEGRTYDKKNNTFREHDVSYVEKALKADTMLEAPSSFKRFMRAQEEIKKRQMRQEIKKRKENGLNVDDLVAAVENDEEGKNGKNNRNNNNRNENKTKKKERKKDDDEKKYEGFYDEDFANAREYAGVQDDVEALPASKTTQKTSDRDDKDDDTEEEEEEEEEEVEEEERESERNDDDDGGNSSSSFSGDDDSEDVEEEIRRRNMPDKGEKGQLFDEDILGEEGKKIKKTKKTKYKSLRERKKEQRAQARIEEEEKEKFLGIVKELPKFGEVAEAPPQITIKRKGGGGGAKNGINGGAGNRQSKIFADLMFNANSNMKKKKATRSRQGPIIGLKRQHDMAVLREDLIAKYREMKNRPSTNGRSASVGAKESSRVFEQRPRFEQIREDAKNAKKKKR